jgi:TonB family protein
VPIQVVSPEVGAYDIGQVVSVEFVVDTAGHTQEISVKRSSDRAFADAVVDAVKQWRFTPAQHNGAPVATRVVLPVRVVEAPKSPNLLVLN